MADISISKSRGKKYLGGASPMVPAFIVGDDPIPLNPPGSVPTTLYKLLGDVTDSDFIGKNGFVPVVNDENVLTLEPLPQVQENGLISGGIVQWTGIGYVFNVSGAFYRIGGISYESPPIQITLATPDVTNNRIDVFAVNSSGVALAITGTPSGSPVKPQIDPQTQLELTSVIVTASSTVPTLTEEVIYDENTEWTGSSTGTGTVVFNSAVDPFQGSVSIEATNIQNGLKIRLTDGSDYDLSTVQTLGFQINLKATMGAGINIGVTFLNSSGSAISTELILNHDKSLLGYQFVGIALSQFSFTSFLARSIEFRYIRTKGTIIYSGFFLDIIKLEGGINPPLGVSSFLALSDTPSTYSGQAGKTVSVKADESGLEFVTGGGGGITGSGTTNEIAYFTGATAIASLAVATYPSLTELSYMKGVTSAVQTQINGKQATIAGTLTDTYVATIVAGVPTWQAPSSGSSKWTDVGVGNIYRNSSISIGQTSDPTNTIDVNGTARIRTISNGVGDFLTKSATGVITSRTAAEVATDIGALSGTISLNNIAVGSATNVISGYADFRWEVSSSRLFISKSGSTGLIISSQFSANSGGVINQYTTANTKYATTNFYNSSNALSASFGYGDSSVIETNLRDSFLLGPRTAGGKLIIVRNVGAVQSATMFSNGNFLIQNGGTHTDNGFRFDINGTLRSQGSFTLSNLADIVFGTTTGTKIATATNQKLSFWNKTPIIQPTTAITGAARVGGGGTTITDTDTFGGYTISQLAAILINTGLTA